MEQPSKTKFFNLKTALFDLLLTILFFVYIVNVCSHHVPSSQENTQILFGAFCAIPLTGVFWLATQFLRVTLTDQLRKNKP